MTTTVNQSHHLLISYVMAVFDRTDYSAERRPKTLILDSLYLEELSIT